MNRFLIFLLAFITSISKTHGRHRWGGKWFIHKRFERVKERWFFIQKVEGGARIKSAIQSDRWTEKQDKWEIGHWWQSLWVDFLLDGIFLCRSCLDVIPNDSSPDCGISREVESDKRRFRSRIVGGGDVSEGEIPWQVGFHFSSSVMVVTSQSHSIQHRPPCWSLETSGSSCVALSLSPPGTWANWKKHSYVHRKMDKWLHFVFFQKSFKSKFLWS